MNVWFSGYSIECKFYSNSSNFQAVFQQGFSIDFEQDMRFYNRKELEFKQHGFMFEIWRDSPFSRSLTEFLFYMSFTVVLVFMTISILYLKTSITDLFHKLLTLDSDDNDVSQIIYFACAQQNSQFIIVYYLIKGLMLLYILILFQPFRFLGSLYFLRITSRATHKKTNEEMLLSMGSAIIAAYVLCFSF